MVNAQIVTDEQPLGLDISQRSILPQKDGLIQTLTAPNRAVINAEDAIADEQPGALRFAYPVHVNYTPNNSGVWQKSVDGYKLWRLKVKMRYA